MELSKYLGYSAIFTCMLINALQLNAGENAGGLSVKRYPHGFKVTSPSLEDEFIRWMVPEGYMYGDQNRQFSSSGFNEYGEEGWRFDSRLEAGSIFRITLTPAGKYVEAEILIDNTEGENTIPATSWGICSDFVNAGSFWSKEAYRRTFIIVDGKLTPLGKTDRSESLNGEMPVYSIKGQAYPGNWAEIIDNGYGWGLSSTLADNSFICISSKCGNWVMGTFFEPIRKLSLNTKGDRVHGCIHSDPRLPEIQPGKSMLIRGRIYLMQGTPDELLKEYQAFLNAL